MKNCKSIKFLTLNLSVFAFLLTPLLAQQQQAIGIPNPLVGISSLPDLILIVTRVVRYVAIPFIVLSIMWAGFLFIWKSRTGQADGIKEARKTLLYTLIGAFILLSAELIALLVKNTIGSLTG